MSPSGHSTTSIPRPRGAAGSGDGGGRSSGRSSKGAGTARSNASGSKAPGRKGSGQQGSDPKGSGSKRSGSKGSGRRKADGEGRTRDLTKPIPREKQLVTGSAKRIGLVVGTVVVFAAIVAALFPIPIRTWLRQGDDIVRKEDELAALEQANAGLANEVDRLKTPEGIEEAAREEIGYVRRGELQLTVLPLPEAPTALPGGWPFDAAAQIVALRVAGTTPATVQP